MCIFKETQRVASKFCITDMDNLVHFLILDLKTSKQEFSFSFSGTKDHTFGAKKEIVCVPYFTDLGTLLEKSFLLILKTSPIIAGESP